MIEKGDLKINIFMYITKNIQIKWKDYIKYIFDISVIYSFHA